jgi:17beta-estradiol 17-dehydrogenase / very-long-chain 3-oxoacyl-CoA reductase
MHSFFIIMFDLLFKILLIYTVFKLVYFYYKVTFRKRLDLLNRYGKDSWVLVTGATDGIGKAYCEEFASMGFNIVLASRNHSKLQKVAKELRTAYNIQTHTITYDFLTHSKTDDYIEAFYELDQDISVLVNNIGTSYPSLFKNQTVNQVKNIIDLNVTPQSVLTRLFAERMMKRQQRSAVIDISSISCFRPFPYSNIYSASKIFGNYLTKALAYEYRDDRIDFLSVLPGLVETNLSRMKADGYHVISPQHHVIAALNDLGYENETCGYWYHKIEFFVLNLLPDFVVYNSISEMVFQRIAKVMTTNIVN